MIRDYRYRTLRYQIRESSKVHSGDFLVKTIFGLNCQMDCLNRVRAFNCQRIQEYMRNPEIYFKLPSWPLNQHILVPRK